MVVKFQFLPFLTPPYSHPHESTDSLHRAMHNMLLKRCRSGLASSLGLNAGMTWSGQTGVSPLLFFVTKEGDAKEISHTQQLLKPERFELL